MPDCSAKGCKNKSKHGVKMNYFPKNPVLREKWRINCESLGNMGGWIPKNSSALCEFHFTADSWEKIRVDGTKKLKFNSVPTIFGDLVYQVTGKVSKEPYCVEGEVLFVNIDNATKEVQLLQKNESLDDNLDTNDTNIKVNLNNNSNSVSIDKNVSEILIIDNTLHINGSISEREGTPDDEHVIELETELKNLKEQLKNSNTTSYEEKFEKLKCIDRKSVYLRLMMKRNAKSKFKKLKKIIGKLKNQVRALEENQKGMILMTNGYSSSLIHNKHRLISLRRDNSLFDARKFKSSCGIDSLKNFLNKDQSLSSLRALNTKFKTWKFISGCSDETFELLNSKVLEFKDDCEKDCLLIIDKISFTPKVCRDEYSENLTGNVTLPGYDRRETATHVIVFTLSGITGGWKQIIDYFFTGHNIGVSICQTLIFDYVKKAHEIGFDVHGVVSGLNLASQCVWRAFGITTERCSPIKNKIPHPVDDQRYLYFFHSAAGDFEILRQGMPNDDFDVMILRSIVEKHDLKTNYASFKLVKALLEIEADVDLEMTTKMWEKYFGDSKSRFPNTRVKSNSNFLREARSILEEKKDKTEYTTGSFLVAQFAKWFKIMTCRHAYQLALTETDLIKYDEVVKFLRDFVELTSSLSFGPEPAWKLLRKGIIVSTVSLLELANFLLTNRNHRSIIGGRFTEAYLESCFFSLKKNNCILDALQLKNHLKLIALTQLYANGPYDKENDCKFLPDFLQTLQKFDRNNDDPSKMSTASVSHYNNKAEYHNTRLDNAAINTLHIIAGELIKQIFTSSEICEFCLACVGRFKKNVIAYNGFATLRYAANNRHFVVDQRTFNFFIEMEKVFRWIVINTKISSLTNLRNFFIEKFMIIPFILPECHRLKAKIVRRFVVFRLKMFLRKNQQKRS